eukprot:jgi/Picsp_1/5201/NSC_02564-R1_glutathione s-transferase
MKPVLYYFDIRGRGEPVRLAMAALSVELEEKVVDYPNMKANLEEYPCAQCPRFVDEDVDMVQSNAIMRHIARKYDLYGTSLVQKAAVDMVIDTVEALKLKHWTLIYVDEVSDEAKKNVWDAHFDPQSVNGRNGGAHMGYVKNMIQKYGSEGFAAGDSFTVADILVFDMFDIFKRIYGDVLSATYPELQYHWDKIAQMPGIREYMASEARCNSQQNANGLG